LSLLTILESNGITDALWALKTVEGYNKEIRLMACDFAESVVHLANDERSINAINVSRDYANGLATEEELSTAASASDAAAYYAAAYAASAAARAAYYAAAYAASAAYHSAASAASASDAAYAAAYTASEATTASASAAARAYGFSAAAYRADYAEREKQIKIFKNYVK
jgi:hypothetical protein